MTDRVRSARWPAALVLGPIAAALFTATTVWATSHTPAPTPNAATATSAPANPTADIRQTLADDTARVAALEQLVLSLRTQVAAIGPTARTSAGPAGPATAAPARALTVPRPPAAVRRTSQPPAVHTVTGASSAAAAP